MSPGDVDRYILRITQSFSNLNSTPQTFPERENSNRQTTTSFVRFDLRVAESPTGARIRWTSSGGKTPGMCGAVVFLVVLFCLLGFCALFGFPLF